MNIRREEFPEEIQKLLNGVSDDELETKIETARGMLEDVEDFFISIACMYVVHNEKRLTAFREYLVRQEKRKDSPRKWFNTINEMSDEHMLQLVHKVIHDCQKRTHIRTAFRERGMSAGDVMPVHIPGLQFQGGLMEFPKDNPETDDPQTGMYL